MATDLYTNVGDEVESDALIGSVPADRAHVPSDRERSRGDAPAAAPPVVVVDHAPRRPSWRRRLAASIERTDPRPAFRSSKFGATPVVVMAVVGLFVGFEGSIASLFAPDIQVTFNYSLGVIGGLVVLSGLLGLVISPVIGYLVDRRKRVTFLRVGALFSQASTLLFPVASTPLIYGTSQLLGNIGGSLQAPVTLPLLCDYYGPRVRTRVFAFQQVAFQLSGVVGLVVAGVVSLFLGWRQALLLFGVIGTVVSLLYLLLREPVRGEEDRLAMGQSQEVAEVEQRPLRFAEAWRATFSVVTQRRLWYATPFVTAMGSAIYVIQPYYLVSVYQASAGLRALIGLIGVVPGMIAAMLAAPVSDRLLARRPGRVLSLGAGGLLFFVAYTMTLAAGPPLWVVVIAGTIPGFIGGVIGPVSLAVQSLVIPARVRGFSFQVGGLIGRISGLAILSILLLFASTNGFQAALLVFGLVGIAGAVLTWYAGFGVERDIRAAMAVTAADEETRRARAAGVNKLVVCRDVDVTYDSVQVLFNVDFDVEEGECVALLGTNGAGKSTLLRAISGIEEASNGAIIFAGEDITHAPPHHNAERGIVMIPGGRAIFPSLSVDENLRAAMWLRRDDEGTDLDEAVQRVHEWFPVLTERRSQLAGTLSGGEQQMLSLGQAFLMKPRLLLIDELSLGLAPQVIEKLLGIIREITASGTTVVLVEQSVNLALTIAGRAVFMEKGEVRFDGPVTELVARPDILRSVFLGRAEGARSLSSVAPAAAGVDSDEAALLEVRGVTVAYGGVTALHDLDLDIGRGEIVGVIGPNGAGKSTLSDVISGYAMPPALTAGSVQFAGRDVTRMSPEARARIGISRSFQNVRLFPQLTVRENIAVALEKRLKVRSALLSALWAPPVRADEKRVRRRVDNLVAALGLEAYREKFVAELSTGSRRIVDIACQLAAQPQLLLLDEPSSGLAQAEAEELAPLIARINRELGCSILLVEHDIPLIRSVAHRLVAMELGSVVTTGEPSEVLSDPRVTRAYLGGTEEVNARSGARPAGAPAP